MMTMRRAAIFLAVLIFAGYIASMPASAGWGKTIYEADSLYHHIRVVDEGITRILRFDNSMETTMTIGNPYGGHFEYVDYFFQSFVLNPDIDSCLMLGLGGASAPKLMQRYFPGASIDIAEIDAMVYDVAQEYFFFTPAENTEVSIQDARVFLRRSDKVYDLVIMDAYTSNKYGSYIPFHLATEEFFEIVDEHLSTNGVFAFNVIGTIYGERKEIVASIYHTMSKVFPNLYLFPSRSSQNVVILASRDKNRIKKSEWSAIAAEYVATGVVGVYPNYTLRSNTLATIEPPDWWKAKVLTDDYAPIDGLLK
jgi:spermidine synthase